MLWWQQLTILITGLLGLISLVLGIYWAVVKDLSFYKPSRIFNPIGVFVYVDGIVIGLFWFLTAILIFYFNDWPVFILTYTAFWFIRSLGEVQYWINQQFAGNGLEKAADYPLNRYIKGKALWVTFQIFWQVIAAFLLVALIYQLKLLIPGL